MAPDTAVLAPLPGRRLGTMRVATLMVAAVALALLALLAARGRALALTVELFAARRLLRIHERLAAASPTEGDEG